MHLVWVIHLSIYHSVPFVVVAGNTSSRSADVKTIKTLLLFNHLNLLCLELSFPPSKCFNMNDKLNLLLFAFWFSVKHILTQFVLLKRILLKLRPALLIGCSYIFKQLILFFYLIN